MLSIKHQTVNLMERLIDKFLTLLLMMAERIIGKCPSSADGPASIDPTATEDPTPTIRFSHEDRMVEGDLFG
jgi:hypothetical protein